MPDDGGFLFYDLNRLPSWIQYTFAARSLLKAVELDNPEETMLVQFTLAELSVATFGLICLVRMFPEFTKEANALSEKIAEIGGEQKFLRTDRFDEDE